MKRRDVLKWAGALSIGGLASPVRAEHVGAAADLGATQEQPVVAQSRGDRKLNILLIVTDQERAYADLPPQLDLPGHEALLASGVSLGNFHVNTTPCSPSRSTMFTGQHTQHTRVTANLGLPPFRELSSDLPTIGHMLRGQGYYTAYKGKWHLSHIAETGNLTYGVVNPTIDALEPFGFSEYNLHGDPHGSHLTGFVFDKLTASDTAAWLHKHAGDTDPWFLAVNFVNPHDIMFYSSGIQQERSRLRQNYLGPISPGPTNGLYAKQWDLPLPASFYKDDLSTKPWAQRADVRLCNGIYGQIQPDDEVCWKGLQSYYFNCIRDVDQSIAQVLDALKASGRDQDTIVILTSDHGEMGGAHKLRQKGPHMYKENTRVNFIVRHPDIQRPFISDALGSSVDLAPTLLEFAGMDPRTRAERYPALAGVSLADSLGGAERRSVRDRRGHLFNYGVTMYIDPDFTEGFMAHADAVSPMAILRESIRQGKFGPSLDNRALFRGVHDGRYKFARYFAPSDHHIPRTFSMLTERNDLELYDTLEDPHELNNLATDPQGQRTLIKRLNRQLNELIGLEIGVDDGREHPGPPFRYS
ncbi:sulfatase-like hydrolase/transferase [Halopseudomonas nanhaiensis]|uniref:sulfatase-like hydrolase/transferase n=1 Tax=Halopseudomonas nanhaiensis TaxID=2830842 RepID=UPI001CBFFD5C|nr:sulfatase-like hydrolase/transferase [Halopseudomonas nanhaiensis]UAW99050.1 sulfatase-like hydrolase/transferase [Halopseudomonas nanhaiensis]